METAGEILSAVAALAGRVRPLGLTLGAPLALAGLAALAAGTRRRRPLAVAGLAALGAVAAVLLRAPLGVHLGLSTSTAAATLAAAGAIAGILAPAALPFCAAALPGALAGTNLPLGGRAAYGAAAGALVAGILGLLLARVVTATAAGLGGALALGLGLLACFQGEPLARELAGRPAVLVGFALVLGIAGAALQLSAPPGGATSRGDPGARSPVSPP
jgi:hypothetical protein